MRPTIQKLTVSAMMAALALLLMMPMFAIPMAFFAPWLKLDFSTLPVLLAGYALGPIWGVAVQLVKTVGHLPMSSSGGIGEIADFVMGTAMVLPASLIYMKNRTRKGAIIGMSVGTALMMLFGALTNYFILLPLYFGTNVSAGLEGALKNRSVINDMGSYITLAVLPFNFIKGALISVATLLIYKKVAPILHGVWKRIRNERSEAR